MEKTAAAANAGKTIEWEGRRFEYVDIVTEGYFKDLKIISSLHPGRKV